MSQSTTLSWDLLKMTSKVYYRRLHKLCAELERHPHKDEILSLMMDQIADDTDTINAYANTRTDL